MGSMLLHLHLKLVLQGIPAWLSGLAPAFGLVRGPWVPGSSPTSGSLRGACFSLCLCICLSLSASLWINKNKIFKKKKTFRVLSHPVGEGWYWFLGWLMVSLLWYGMLVPTTAQCGGGRMMAAGAPLSWDFHTYTQICTVLEDSPDEACWTEV